MRSAFYLLSVAILLSAPFPASGSDQPSTPVKAKERTATRKVQPFHIFNPDAMAKPATGYSQVVEGNEGKIVYIAGQIAVDRSGNLVGKDDFRAQVQQVFENLKTAVEATGGDFKSVVKLNYYCAESVDPSQIPVMREVRDKYVNTANPPVSTFAVVKRLARPEWLIEVEAVAVVKK